MVVLETKRLWLRFLEAADLDALAAIYADPQVMHFIGGPLDRHGTWERLERAQTLYRQRRCGPYAVILKNTGELAGRCGFLHWRIDGRDEVEVAYLLARGHWGQGLAVEAVRGLVGYGFERLGFHRLIALIHPDNTASIRVAESASLKLEREIDLPIYGTRRLYSVSS